MLSARKLYFCLSGATGDRTSNHCAEATTITTTKTSNRRRANQQRASPHQRDRDLQQVGGRNPSCPPESSDHRRADNTTTGAGNIPTAASHVNTGDRGAKRVGRDDVAP